MYLQNSAVTAKLLVWPFEKCNQTNGNIFDICRIFGPLTQYTLITVNIDFCTVICDSTVFQVSNPVLDFRI